MGIGAAIISGVSSYQSGRQQRRAGRQAQAAAEEGALGIEAETEMNIEQTRRSQQQILGRAKANIAASGIRFDASKIAAVEFTEQETEAGREKRAFHEQTLAKLKGRIGLKGRRGLAGKIGGVMEATIKGTEYETEVVQTAGATEDSSTFNYLREMKRNFASEISWMGKEGRSRAKVMRMGGQVAKAQAYAGGAQSYASAASSFAGAGRSAGWWD